MKTKILMINYLILITFITFQLFAQNKGNDSFNRIKQINTQIINGSTDKKKVNFKKSIIEIMKDNIQLAKDVVYIIFLITTMTVAIITYRRAKHTILQPLKTEVIKKQISIFTNLINFLEDQRNFNFHNIISLNTINFIYSFENYKSMIINTEQFNTILQSRKGSFGIDISKRDIKNPGATVGELFVDPIMKFENSGKYVVSEILLDNDDIKMQNTMLNLVKNPLIPKKIKNKIEKAFNDYRESLRNILPSILEEYLNVIYNESKITIITKEYIMLKIMIINNLYNQKRINHEISIEEIKKEMNKYLKIENLF